MQPTVYQKPELRDANDNIIQQGAFGKNTALANATNDGWIDYVANDLEFLYDLAKDEVVPVPSLPASGQTNKTYLLTTTGVSYRWSGTEWVAVSSSEAVGRAETAANLAEQWATKTSGTVDGTEYSAKYYAGLAEASADDAQDTADDMATHLVQIDKNTGGVAKNSKRISNIEKLLQGNLYDYDTDDDVAYTKTVPSGALPYAGIETLGGKTVVMNQGVQPINNENWQGFNTGVSVSYTDGVADCTLQNNTEPNFYRYGFELRSTKAYNTINGHKYLYSYDVKSNVAEVAFISQCVLSSGSTDGTVATANEWTNHAKIITATADLARRFLVYPSSAPSGLVYSIRNAMLIDLTLMFGSGNEPSTVAEFEAMFPADYYPYNAGTLLSAGVTEVKSVGKNLCDGSAVVGAISSNQAYIVSNTPISSPYTTTANFQGAMFYANVEAGKTYTISTDITSGNNSNTWFWAIYKNLTSATSRANLLEYDRTATNSFTPTKTGVCVFMHYYSTNVSVSWTKVQLEVGSTATAYVPYMERTMPIPAEVRALEGYGWSAGTAYNYIDFERKVFVKCVDRVDLGTLTYTDNGVQNNSEEFICANNAIPGRAFSQNLVCAKFVNLVGLDTISINTMRGRTNSNGITFYWTLGETASNFKSYVDGVYLYYELATPIETDISAYLTDNLIEVGAGGTLTFPNSNGNDYHIPVPSTETYMIDLQEAISNG